MDNNEKIRKRYDRASSFYDFFEQPMEIMTLKKWRTEVMRELHGDVLEVGVGMLKIWSFLIINLIVYLQHASFVQSRTQLRG